MTRLGRHSSWLWILGALAAVAAISFATSSPSRSASPLSIESARPNGALALALWLQRSGYSVRGETSADLGLRGLLPGRDTLVVLTPDTDLSAAQANAVLSWVGRGGRLVLGTDGANDSALLGRLGLAVDVTAPADIQMSQPLLLSPPVVRPSGQAFTVIRGIDGDSAVASTRYGPVLGRVPWGRGLVWVSTAPALLDNADIARADNRRLALNLVGAPGGTIAFDEYGGAAANAPSPPNWLFGTVWGVALLFALAVLMLYRFLSGARLGPPVMSPTDDHRPAVEYVVSMAGLLRRAGRRADVLQRYQGELRRALSDRGGAGALDEPHRVRIGRLLAAPGPLSEDELRRRVQDILECEERLRRTPV